MDEPNAVANRGPDVMVSYSSHDRPQVMQFVQRLRAAGVAAWIDQGGIDGAQKWGEEIVNAIDACKTVVLMISPTSMQSENIAKEVMLAWENGKHFLPLCLEDAKIPKSMQYQLAGIQQIKLYEGDPEAKFVAVLRALVRLGVQVSPYYIALASADLGNHEQAFEWLNRALEQRSSGLSRLKTEARFNFLRSDPRFAEVMRRAESLPLADEAAIPEDPALVPRPIAVPAAVSAPAPWWKKILWPDIVNDPGARQAAAQGVWACVFVVVATFLASMLTSIPGGGAVLGTGWNNPLVVLVIFAPIAFGIQKMGRPAAIIALILCSFGAMGNLGTLQGSSKMLDAYSSQYQRYQQYPQYKNPALARSYAQATSHYYYSWLSLVISLLCAGAFANATRGTFAYRRMVMMREAQDKQDAISAADWAGMRTRISALFQRSQGAIAAARATRAAKASAVRPVVPAPPARVSGPRPAPAEVVVPAPAEAVVPPASEPVAPEVAPVAALPMRQSFAALMGVSGGIIYWPRVLTFLVANVVAGWMFLLGRFLTTSVAIPAGYWLLAIFAGCLFTAAVVAAFRFLPNVWSAGLVAAIAFTILVLPLYSMLPSFTFGDLFYREQFQQFLLLPLVNSFILVAGLIWVVPRLQPLVLALWLGAMGTEIATGLVANLLHALGAGDPPDAVLGGASVISALFRSAAFALVLWGGLEYLKKRASAAA